MTDAAAVGLAYISFTATVCAAIQTFTWCLTKPRPVKASARQDLRKQWQPLPTVEAELFGGPHDGAVVAIPAHQPDAVIHRGHWYRMDSEGIYRHDPTTHLTGRN